MTSREISSPGLWTAVDDDTTHEEQTTNVANAKKRKRVIVMARGRDA